MPETEPSMTETLAVIDFETTGVSPDHGSRATEIAVVLVRAGRIVDRYPSLMNAKVPIPPFIVQLTGITPAMIRHAPPTAEVMRQATEFIGDCPLIAHNAAFDRKVLDAELARIHQSRRQEFACTVLLARRLYPDAPNHPLGTLVEDAERTAHLLLRMETDVQTRYRLPTVSHARWRLIQQTPRSALGACLERYRQRTPGR